MVRSGGVVVRNRDEPESDFVIACGSCVAGCPGDKCGCFGDSVLGNNSGCTLSALSASCDLRISGDESGVCGA